MSFTLSDIHPSSLALGFLLGGLAVTVVAVAVHAFREGKRLDETSRFLNKLHNKSRKNTLQLRDTLYAVSKAKNSLKDALAELDRGVTQAAEDWGCDE